MRTPLCIARLACFASALLASCVLDIADTQCLSNVDCPSGSSCGENADGDRVCLPGSGPADTGGNDAGVDTGVDTGTGTEANCTNGVDDDGDGAIDCADPDCAGRPACGCGDGTTQENEDCDGDDLDGESCATLGFAGGRLGCSDACTYDVSECATPEELIYTWDSWGPGQPVEGNVGIATGDMAYSCFETPSDDIDYVVTAVAFGMAGDFNTRRAVDFLIWNQQTQLTESEVVFTERFDVPSDAQALHIFTIAESRVRVSGFFCLGVIHNGIVGPTIANDFDGIVAPAAQGLVRTIGGVEQVFAMEDVAFGDWILRAAILPAVR